jgi:hypothetical protein
MPLILALLFLMLDSSHPELEEKVRRCVMQAHIDPEDFNGVSILDGMRNRAEYTDLCNRTPNLTSQVPVELEAEPKRQRLPPM